MSSEELSIYERKPEKNDSNVKLKNAAKLLVNKDNWFFFLHSGNIEYFTQKKKKFSIQCVSSNTV